MSPKLYNSHCKKWNVEQQKNYFDIDFSEALNIFKISSFHIAKYSFIIDYKTIFIQDQFCYLCILLEPSKKKL